MCPPSIQKMHTLHIILPEQYIVNENDISPTPEISTTPKAHITPVAL